jgi:hypothetical protein
MILCQNILIIGVYTHVHALNCDCQQHENGDSVNFGRKGIIAMA